MPDLNTFEQLAAGHGVGMAVLIMACIVMGAVVISLWRENKALYGRIEELLKERVAVLEQLLEGGLNDRPRPARRG
ncbi:MAG: hypothetical protein KatS3mg005_3408 [Bryobacteraceae bacterium]|jgi:hypothetical protein|nr:MAG: hypothetical protein KatS3mg005_3408 [Bryobacteraceae bacterium]